MYTPVSEHFLRTGDGKETTQAPTPSFDPNPVMALHQTGLTPAAILLRLPSKFQDYERPHHTTLHRTAPHGTRNPILTPVLSVNQQLMEKTKLNLD